MPEDVSTTNKYRSGAGSGALGAADATGIVGSKRHELNANNEASRRFIT
jgi:hypothetical protein